VGGVSLAGGMIEVVFAVMGYQTSASFVAGGAFPSCPTDDLMVT